MDFACMTPDALRALQAENGLVYQPVGSLEWHGPHLGFGVDTLHAQAVARRCAAQLGGAVLPPLYIGTETPRTPEAVARLGFAPGTPITGMDFPENTVKSLYWPPEVFEAVVTTQVRLLRQSGFARVLLINGHAAAAQVQILEAAAAGFAPAGSVRAVTLLMPGSGVPLGHAGQAETALMQLLCPEMVHLENLPDGPLDSRRLGIADRGGCPPPDYLVQGDPRAAAAGQGETLLDFETRQCLAVARQMLDTPVP